MRWKETVFIDDDDDDDDDNNNYDATINMKRMTCIQTAVNVIWSEDRV